MNVNDHIIHMKDFQEIYIYKISNHAYSTTMPFKMNCGGGGESTLVGASVSLCIEICCTTKWCSLMVVKMWPLCSTYQHLSAYHWGREERFPIRKSSWLGHILK